MYVRAFAPFFFWIDFNFRTVFVGERERSCFVRTRLEEEQSKIYAVHQNHKCVHSRMAKESDLIHKFGGKTNKQTNK
jgi:hypothetical protein